MTPAIERLPSQGRWRWPSARGVLSNGNGNEGHRGPGRERGNATMLRVSSQTDGGIPGRGHHTNEGLEARNKSWGGGGELSQQTARALSTRGRLLQTLAHGNGFPVHPRTASESSDFLWVDSRRPERAKQLGEERSAADRPGARWAGALSPWVPEGQAGA